MVTYKRSFYRIWYFVKKYAYAERPGSLILTDRNFKQDERKGNKFISNSFLVYRLQNYTLTFMWLNVNLVELKAAQNSFLSINSRFIAKATSWNQSDAQILSLRCPETKMILQ